jgi:hypothetical protein
MALRVAVISAVNGVWWCSRGVWSIKPAFFAEDSTSTSRDDSFVTKDMVTGGWRIARSLQGGSVVCSCLVRLVYHLLACMGRWSFVPLAGLLPVDWRMLVRRPCQIPVNIGFARDVQRIRSTLLVCYSWA